MNNTPEGREWVAKLRDPEVLQVNGIMQVVPNDIGTPVGYCCLGVIEDLVMHREMGCTGPTDNPGRQVLVATVPVEDGPDVKRWSNSRLHPDTAELLGLSDGDQSLLVTLNDSNRYDFAAIADVLETAMNFGVTIERAVFILARDRYVPSKEEAEARMRKTIADRSERADREREAAAAKAKDAEIERLRARVAELESNTPA